jgi:ADP-ribosylglycohydrolase
VLSLLLLTGIDKTLNSFFSDSDPNILKRLSFITEGKSQFGPAAKEQIEALKACLLGEAIGDALGVPVEFSTLQQIRSIGRVEEYLHDPSYNLAPGEYSDDTEMGLLVTKTIVRTGRIEFNEIAQDFGSFGLAVDLGQVRNRGFSRSTLTSYRRLYAGLNWRLAANSSNGCGPATAVVPLGVLTKDLQELINNVRGVTLITKSGKEALAGSLATAYLIHQARWGQLSGSPAEIIERTAKIVEDTSPVMAFEIRRLTTLLGTETEEGLNRIPHNADGKKVRVGMKTVGVVPSAIYCFVKSLTDFRQTILSAIHTEGDSDSIAAIAGAISATHNGLEAIPLAWQTGLVGGGEISQLVQNLPK